MEQIKKQTAVEWLEDKLLSEPHSELDFKHNSECWDKAKEMEKQQINKACFDGYYQEGMYDVRNYYNETFNLKKPINK
jgi:hypothetical protein